MMRYAFFPQMPQNRTYSFRFFSRFKIDPSKINAIGLTGNMVGAWPIDQSNKPIRNAILWNDTRSQKVFEMFE